MNKFVLGGILAVISLLAIYGASASNRVTSWMDGSRPSPAPTDTEKTLTPPDDSFIALTPTNAERADVNIDDMTPLEKAGTLPQRQTIGVTPNFGGTDDTEGGVIEPNPSAADSENNTANNNQTNQTNQNPTPDSGAIRALW
ncbi:MAG: hypothetical protein AAF821_14145 [Cyanobacteria bacterium P01_D01_bin.156]